MKQNTILNYWFDTIDDDSQLSFEHPTVKRWNDKSPKVDQYIIDNFSQTYNRTLNEIRDGWQPRTVQEYLAAIILVDQFPRHIFRGTANMYQSDVEAVALAQMALHKFEHRNQLNLAERMFLYMPLMHSENLADEQKMAELFANLRDDAKQHSPVNAKFFQMTYGFAARHLEIVQRFGRFPHRNQILGRVSTQEEVEFLTEDNSSF